MDNRNRPGRLRTCLSQERIQRGLNWYRNTDWNWERSAFLSGAPLRQPALFVAGEVDAVITMMRPLYDALDQTVPNLRKKPLIPGAGHWVQQERPAEVNRLLLEFVTSMSVKA